MTGEVQIGDRFGHLRPVSGMEGVVSPRAFPAEVVYVHPARDWFTVEFDMPGGKCRESYFSGLRSRWAESPPPEPKSQSKRPPKLPNQPKAEKKSRYVPVEHDKRHDSSRSKRPADLTGMKFGELTVLEPAPRRKSRKFWLCRCDCGTVKEICQDNLIYGNSKSCGCRAGRPKKTIPEERT